jgi:hypothetical protein
MALGGNKNADIYIMANQAPFNFAILPTIKRFIVNKLL